jgi:hypothetical protein
MRNRGSQLIHLPGMAEPITLKKLLELVMEQQPDWTWLSLMKELHCVRRNP